MKLTIIPSDNAVYVDGVCRHDLVLPTIPDEVRVLQWNNDAGWLEFKHTVNNEEITALPQWALDCVDLYNIPALQPEPVAQGV